MSFWIEARGGSIYNLRPPGKAGNGERELAMDATWCACVYVLGP